ncbi:31089_t:CDS:2, partial [Racocetra persica]
MIQILPNELHIQILTFVVTETNFENFCALRTVCKKWNTFVPLVMHEAVISKLNSGLNLELTDWNETKWSKKLSPTYDDNTKTFTFLFDSADATKSLYDYEKPHVQNSSFVAFVKRSEDVSIPLKLGYKFGDLAFPEFVNSDIDKYEFDHQSNVCFKREIKVDEEGKDINCKSGETQNKYKKIAKEAFYYRNELFLKGKSQRRRDQLKTVSFDKPSI